ncbi:kelch domain-containing protein 2-like [Lingula anatina]|uniref:Kelch domain-containing protein 2-like n=1 Tax=Lingula anatina TaxID=7574 RepID=A0A1S3IQ24_LINAN|nr:kelch domain-containing protein 2-like [Lingula anatina]|eukprot:XP_013400168.1 kelch domain-containing protein 2-like [Lingula anatina]
MSGGIVSSRAPTPRTGHVAIAYDHYMFVWGGYQNELTERYLSPDELWIYDSYLDSWQLRILEPEEDTSINCPPGTSGASAVLKGDAVYLFGGHCYAGNTNELYRLNLQEFCWEYVHSNSLKPSPRDKLSMWEYGNSLYVFGGFGPPLEGYLKEHGIWIPDESSSSYRGWNNQLLDFDLKTRMWSNPKCSGPVPSPRAAHAATRVGNKVYLFGGRHCSQRLNDLHCLNLDTMTWSGSLHTGGSIPVGRSWHTFSAVSSTEIFLYGGFTQDNDTLCKYCFIFIFRLIWVWPQ